MNKQKFFNFEFEGVEDSTNYYVNSTNKSAYEGLLNDNNQFNFLIGPEKSGKSFLGRIWSKNYNAIKYIDNFDFIINNKLNVLIDNLPEHSDEEKLFHIMNHCHQFKCKVLITSNLYVYETNFKLKDLLSRLKTFHYYKINNPDDDMLLNILTKKVIEKQFIINSKEIFYYILQRANRSYKEVISIINKLDNLSLEKKRQLTIPLIREIL